MSDEMRLNSLSPAPALSAQRSEWVAVSVWKWKDAAAVTKTQVALSAQ